jgi:hypothetical protein
MKTRLLTLALTLALLGLVVAAPAGAGAQTTNPLANIPIVGTLLGGGTFSGTLNITNFAVQNGELVAQGLLNGVLTDAAGVAHNITNVAVTLPVDLLQTTGSCTILHLVLGPLDLNLLGLMVHLDRVVLDITAQSGPGNLLGNLLCNIAHLLDSNAANRALANALNRLLGGLLG